MSKTSLRKSFSSDLQSVGKRLAAGRQRLIIPLPTGLHRRRHASHFHHTPEFFLQTGGATDFVCPGGSFRLQTGDICVMPTGVPHAETPIDLRTPYGVVVLMNREASCLCLRGWADAGRRIQSGDFLESPLPTKAFRLLEEASNQHLLPKRLQSGFSTGLVSAFLASVLVGLNADTAPEIPTSTPLVAEVEKIIRVEISRQDLSVGALASRFGCSPDHLTRRFRAERGVALNAWIIRERIDLACNLLERPEHNIAEVGWACGFSSPSYFISVFTRQKGVTPLTWRKNTRGNY
jgi:AraC-like DNA-binding protein